MLELNVYPETVRNQLLRRVDWRFLLADMQPANSICFARGLLGEAVKLISDNVVDGTDYAVGYDGGFDLAVVSDPAPATLEAAWRALRPGGALYGEWNRPLAATRMRVTRQLTAMGFAPPVCYWPSSAPERAAAGAWLPLGAPGALRYYAESRSGAVGAVRKTLLRSKWRLWQAVAGLGVAMPLCAVAYKPLEDAEARGILECLRQEWRELGLGAPPRQLHWLLLTGGLRSINKAVGLVFGDNEAKPRLAIKMARVPESLPALAHEANILRALHAQHYEDVEGVPKVLLSEQWLAETALSGTPLWMQLTRANFVDFAAKATAWQVGLAGDAAPAERSTWCDRLVARELARFATIYGPAVDGQQLRCTAELLRGLPDLPLVCEQRDFSPWNVLLHDQELVVLDWEGAELNGLPLLDLVYFLTYLALFVENVQVHGEIDIAQVRRVYRATLDSRHELGRVIQACLSDYLQKLKLPIELMHPLRLLTWMVHARSEYEALWTKQGDTPDAARLRRSVFLHLWEEELSTGSRRA